MSAGRMAANGSRIGDGRALKNICSANAAAKTLL
jgi:hypothetical protein